MLLAVVAAPCLVSAEEPSPAYLAEVEVRPLMLADGSHGILVASRMSSGATEATLFDKAGASIWSRWLPGVLTSAVGDVNGDGRPDLIVMPGPAASSTEMTSVPPSQPMLRDVRIDSWRDVLRIDGASGQDDGRLNASSSTLVRTVGPTVQMRQTDAVVVVLPPQDRPALYETNSGVVPVLRILSESTTAAGAIEDRASVSVAHWGTGPSPQPTPPPSMEPGHVRYAWLETGSPHPPGALAIAQSMRAAGLRPPEGAGQSLMNAGGLTVTIATSQLSQSWTMDYLGGSFDVLDAGPRSDGSAQLWVFDDVLRDSSAAYESRLRLIGSRGIEAAFTFDNALVVPGPYSWEHQMFLGAHYPVAVQRAGTVAATFGPPDIDAYTHSSQSMLWSWDPMLSGPPIAFGDRQLAALERFAPSLQSDVNGDGMADIFLPQQRTVLSGRDARPLLMLSEPAGMRVASMDLVPELRGGPGMSILVTMVDREATPDVASGRIEMALIRGRDNALQWRASVYEPGVPRNETAASLSVRGYAGGDLNGDGVREVFVGVNGLAAEGVECRPVCDDRSLGNDLRLLKVAQVLDGATGSALWGSPAAPPVDAESSQVPHVVASPFSGGAANAGPVGLQVRDVVIGAWSATLLIAAGAVGVAWRVTRRRADS